jgi:hypothetical protein
MLMISAFGLVGPQAVVPMAAAMVVGGLSISILSDSSIHPHLSGRKVEAEGVRFGPHSALLFFSVFCGSGGFLFVGVSGVGALIAGSLVASPIVAAIAILSLFMVSTLGFLAAWRLLPFVREAQGPSYKWSGWISLLTLMSGAGVFWHGTFTGYESSVLADRLMGSVLNGLFSEPMNFGQGYVFIGVQFVILLFGGLISWWGYRSSRDWAAVSGKNLQRVLHFVAAGYETDRGFSGFLRGVQYFGGSLRSWIDERVFSAFVPRFGSRFVTGLGRVGYRLDGLLGQVWARGFSSIGEALTAGLRQVHSGNLQWYITFAIGAGIALLIHFLLSQNA